MSSKQRCPLLEILTEEILDAIALEHAGRHDASPPSMVGGISEPNYFSRNASIAAAQASMLTSAVAGDTRRPPIIFTGLACQ